MQVTLSPRRFFIVGLVILVLLSVGNAVSVYARHVMGLDFALGVIPLFNFDEESNFPTLFNGLLLAFGAVLAWMIGRHLKAVGGGNHRGWLGGALVLVFLTLDETCRIHEAVHYSLMDRLQLGGAVAWPWVIPYAVLAAVVAVFFARFFFALERRYQFLFAGAGCLYVASAIGMEMAEAAHTQVHGEESLGFGILYSIEETGEILAVLIADWGMLAFLRDRCPGFRFGLRVAGGDPGEARDSAAAACKVGTGG